MDFLAINWADPSWDLFIVLLFIVSAFIYGLSLGRDRILVILTSMYMALAIVNTAPYLDQFSFKVVLGSGSMLKVTVFVGVFVLLFFVMSRSAIINTFNCDYYGKWWHAIIFSFFHTGLMISIVLQYLPKEIVSFVSAPMQSYFLSDPARFFWFIVPIVSMVLLGKKPL